MWIVCIDRICIIHYHYNDLNLFFPFHLVREEISEIYRYIIFNNIFLNFAKYSHACLLGLLPVMKHSQWEMDRGRGNTHIKIGVSIYKGGSARQKDINIILKFLFLCIFHNNIGIGSRSCQNWRCVWSEGDSEFIRVISDKVRVVQIQLGWLVR